MTKICEKWRIYLGIGLSVWETAKIFGKWRRSVGNVSNMWIGLIVWETAKIFGKWRRSVGNGSNMWGNDLIICQNILKMWKVT